MMFKLNFSLYFIGLFNRINHLSFLFSMLQQTLSQLSLYEQKQNKEDSLNKS